MQNERATAPAWQVRDMVRDHFITTVMDKIHTEEQTSPEEWNFDLVRQIVSYLAVATEYEEVLPNDWGNPGPAYEFFNREIEVPMHRLANSKQEVDFWMCQLLKQVLESATHVIRHRYNQATVLAPKTIYGVTDSMEEVPLPDYLLDDKA